MKLFFVVVQGVPVIWYCQMVVHTAYTQSNCVPDWNCCKIPTSRNEAEDFAKQGRQLLFWYSEIILNLTRPAAWDVLQDSRNFAFFWLHVVNFNSVYINYLHKHWYLDYFIWRMSPYNLLGIYMHYQCLLWFILNERGGKKFSWKVGIFTPDYTASHITRQGYY
jgi:hypothetical protein